MIKLIVTDLDGTLIMHGDISKKNLEAIEYAKERGADLVLATGRDFSMIEGLIENNQLKCLSITGNGAEFRDKDGSLITSEYLGNDQYKSIAKIFLEENIPFMIYTTNGFYCEQDPIWIRDSFLDRGKQRFGQRTEKQMEVMKDMPCMKLQKIDNIDTFLEGNPLIIKIEAFTVNDPKPILEVAKKFESFTDIAYLSSYDDNLEITAKKAQKGIILEEACKKLGIHKDEVMVLGDGMNDYSMFERFKYSFAPANSVKEILDAAYMVVSSCEDDGFSEAIYQMIK